MFEIHGSKIHVCCIQITIIQKTIVCFSPQLKIFICEKAMSVPSLYHLTIYIQ